MGILADLAAQISRNALVVDRYLEHHGLPDPSFEAHGPVELLPASAEAENEALAKALEATLVLQDLLLGPNELLRPMLNGTSLQLIHRFNIAEKVPREGVISYEDLASQIPDVDADHLQRCMRHAIAHHRIFLEPCPGRVAHSAASLRLIDNVHKRDAFGLMIDGFYPGYSRTVDALQMGPKLSPYSTGFTLAHGSESDFYGYLDEAPELRRQFTSAMSSFAKLPGASLDSVLRGFPWKDLPEGALVVDLGGAEGETSLHLSAALPHLEFVSQDRASVVGDGKAIGPRVRLMAHDFLKTQTTRADVYLFRWIMHNWPGEYCVMILRNLIPMLQEEAYVLINDMIISDSEERTLMEERYMREAHSKTSDAERMMLTPTADRMIYSC